MLPRTCDRMEPFGGTWTYIFLPMTSMMVATSMSTAGTPKANE